jgi:DNA-binding LytR/AlgR family response regulator
MKKYLIVEDERLAFSELKRMVDRLRPDYQLLGRTESVLESVEFLQEQKPDFILMDISLSDGSCFEILIISKWKFLLFLQQLMMNMPYRLLKSIV